MPLMIAALHHEPIETKLGNTGVPTQDTLAMLPAEQSRALASRNEQIVLFHGFVENECRISLTAKANVLCLAFKPVTSERRGVRSKRPPGAEPDEDNPVADFIERAFESGN
jgi:hypothetical protein